MVSRHNRQRASVFSMTCFSPLKGYQSREFNPATGRYGITFNATQALNSDRPMAIPCGQCVGCRMNKAQQWAIRCMHEAKLYEQNAFITLTYNDQSVPADYSVKLRDWQLFMKRLRKHDGSNKIRFFACGEYGGQLLRPHYHALLFNYSFSDQKYFRTHNKNSTYRSEILSELWPHGFHEIGNVNYKSAGYVCRYSMKKINGDRADSHYTRVSPIDGNIYTVAKEFAVMSRRPGIGTGWFNKFQTDAFPQTTVLDEDGNPQIKHGDGFIIVEGKRVKPPRFYLNKLAENAQETIKRERKRYAMQPRQKANSTADRLKVREKVQSLRAKRLLRPLES